MKRIQREQVGRLAFALSAAAALSCAHEEPGSPPAQWLLERAVEQRVLAGNSPAFQGFRLEDRRAASGITFMNRITAGRTFS